jgi:phasin protein
MAKQTKQSEEFQFGFQQPFMFGTQPMLFGAQFMRMASYPLEFWLHCQEAMLNAAGPMGEEWTKRRRAGITAALRALEELKSCDDLAEAAVIQREWMAGAMERLAADAQAMAEQGMTFSQDAIKAGQAAAKVAEETGIETLRATGKAA